MGTLKEPLYNPYRNTGGNRKGNLKGVLEEREGSEGLIRDSVAVVSRPYATEDSS